MTKSFVSPEEIVIQRWQDSLKADRVTLVDSNGNIISNNNPIPVQSKDYLIEDNVVVNRNPDGSVASLITTIGTTIRTETINRNSDGSVASITVGVI
jgi:hypothetical protein